MKRPKDYFTGENDGNGFGSIINIKKDIPSSELGEETNAPGTKWYDTSVLVCISPNDQRVQLDFEGGSITLNEDGTYIMWEPVG